MQIKLHCFVNVFSFFQISTAKQYVALYKTFIIYVKADIFFPKTGLVFLWPSQFRCYYYYDIFAIFSFSFCVPHLMFPL